MAPAETQIANAKAEDENGAAKPALDAAQVAAALNSIGQALDDHDAWLAELSQENQRLAAAVADSHSQLAAWQKTETETRYADVARLIDMVQRQGAILDNRLITLAGRDAIPAGGRQGQ
jgi:septal ring factor EnvC (AmiA/AmiB activator)